MNIKSIRNYLRTKVGTDIIIIYYGSRNRKEKFSGILYKLYDNVFTIRLFNGEIRCFSYTDIITKTIQICI